MATPPNPLTGAGAGGGGGANPLSVIMGALANKTQNPGQSFSQQSSQLQGSDPTMVARQLDQINSLLGTLFIKTFQTQPNLANQISATMKALSRAIKESQQGSQIAETVGAQGEPSPQITNAAATPPQGQQPGPPDGSGI